jgi:hypothetical protein
VKENLNYLAAIRKAAKTASRRRSPEEFLETVKIEDCGKSRVYLGGLAQALHERNLRMLVMRMQEEGEEE